MLGLLPRNSLLTRLPTRTQRSTSPAKILLVIFILVGYLAFPLGTSKRPLLLSDPQIYDTVSHASLPELLEVYDQARLGVLEDKAFDPSATAKKLRAPILLPDGTHNFDPDLSIYIERLRGFVDGYFSTAPAEVHTGARNALDDLMKKSPSHSRPDELPRKIWSTHPRGIEGVEEGFELWKKLLPLPLSRTLLKEMGYKEDIEWLEPAKKGGDWEVVVMDDDGLDRLMSQWTSEEVSRGVVGEGKWQKLWGKFDRGVLRADLFRYMSMLVKGDIYSDSDTMPISHPYLWGLNAPSIVHPDIEALPKLIKQTSSPSSANPNLFERQSSLEIGHSQHNSTDPEDNARIYQPPYYAHSKRAPVHPDDQIPTTILNPEISIIVAIEWDSMIGRTLSMWRQWTWWRFRRSWPDRGFPRGLQMVQNQLISKPFHPIMLDTIATIAGMVESGKANELGPLELTGPGPFTDAVLRYLLVQYGITPSDLRALRGPVRVGDVLILQEEAWHAPDKAIARLISHVDSLGSSLAGKKDPWIFGSGWESWQNGGKKVSYHGLTGIWKGKSH
ncbi:hypothetical protein I302_108323 [Kwoniella bestiolae CBS 10118]|uniref:Alpha-1,6-mannosyltransferase n=1 Tax=Kwoniella bestiolae CBS 10118 TaxID=1296100 RepID=A0AAJ8KE66_9TREE